MGWVYGPADHGELAAEGDARPRLHAHDQAPRDRSPNIGQEPQWAEVSGVPASGVCRSSGVRRAQRTPRREEQRNGAQAKQWKRPSMAGATQADTVSRPARQLLVLRKPMRVGWQRQDP